MISRRYCVLAAVFTLTSGSAARSALAQGTMMHDMAQGSMKHDMAAMPSLASMMQRADSLIGRTEKMMRSTADTTAHAMMVDHTAYDSSQAMAGSLHAMAIGLRGVLQHMDAMHRAGMKMEGSAGTAMMDVHRRMNTMLGEMEKTLAATDKMHAHHAKSSP